MAGIKISALPAVASALTTDFFPVVQGGVTSRETLDQVQTLFQDGGGFVLTSPSADQTITAHSLTLAAGILTSGAQTGGVDGSLILYPNSASVGGFRFLNNTVSTFSTTVSNSSVGQAMTVSIPDAGAAAANFILSKNAGTQHITSGGLAIDAGILTSGISTGGTAGKFTGFSPTATSGSLSVVAADSGGNFANVLTNASTAAARTWTLPDATGTLALASGTVAVATTVTTTATNSTNASFFPTFVASGTSGNQGIDTATGITFNPSSNTLTTTTFSGALSGNATTATTATNVAVGGITGLGTGVATALAANVNGSGAISLTTSATFVTPVLGVASATSIAFSSTSGVIGTTTNDSAPSGSVGYFVSATTSFGSPVSLTSDTPANICSISLPAGDFDVWGNVGFLGGASTIVSYLAGWISSTSATNPGRDAIAQRSFGGSGVTVFNQANDIFNVPQIRVSLASPTTIYLSAQAGFSISTCSGYGNLCARERR
jgi:hypothetical protein